MSAKGREATWTGFLQCDLIRLDLNGGMTPAELDAALDVMLAAAGDDSDRMPGLITVQTNDWINSTSAIGAKCARLDDGLRHRDIVIHIGAQQKTKVLTRSEAGERGAPYRDLMPRA